MKQSKNPNPAVPEQETTAAQDALPMQVAVKIHSIHMEGQVLADASANINGCFAIRGIRVVQGSDGPFASMPSYKSGGEYKDICFPTTKEFYQQFQQAVVGAYQQELAQLYDRRMGNMGQQQPAQAAPEMGMQM